MARIKEWKKVRDDDYGVVWENKGANGYWVEICVLKTGKGWAVEKNTQRVIKRLKYFKTKTQALRYAKLWMRKHPNG